MLDRYIVPLIKPRLTRVAAQLYRWGLRADQVTVGGFAFGLCSVFAIAAGQMMLGLAFLLANRIADGLDGELARQGAPSQAGSFLDISLDFIFYALFPMAFALHEPAANALPAAVLVASFVGTGASFLAFAAHADRFELKSPDFSYKGLYYIDGLAEGTETIICFVIMCLLPNHFALIAYAFAFVCAITAVNRVFSGYLTLRRCERSKSSN